MAALAATPPQPRRPDSRDLSLREMLADERRFITAVELVTTRGIISDKAGKHSLGLARDLAAHPRVDVLSITDNPGGNAMLAADTLGTDLIARGQEVIIHLSCKDWNRNALQSRAWKLASEGFRNVLALSGDFPVGGYEGQASAVFDIDSVGLLNMFSRMNRELASPEKFFHLGAVVTNHKRLESEVMPQYFKLAKKIRNGAEFIINQIGYDARKQDELLRYMRREGWHLPVLYNVFVLSAPAARFFHKGRIPGCVVTDELMALIEEHAASPDKGKGFLLELAAKQCAIGRGLGYRGVYVGGHLKLADYEKIFALVDSFAPDDWRPVRPASFASASPASFSSSSPTPATGLSSDAVNAEYLRSISPEGRRAARRRVPFVYRVNRALHNLVFEHDSPGFKLAAKVYRRLERHPRLAHPLHAAEHVSKIAMFDCRDCGDCSLPDIAYLCPESQCAKNQRNGPCGGTRQGKCEVGEKQCIWARAYERMKPYGEELLPYQQPVIYKNGALKGTSAWANTFLDRDHHARLRAAAAAAVESVSPDKTTKAG